MEKEMFPRAYLAERYPEFAEHFMQGDILIMEDGNKRIIRFTNTYPAIFRPKLLFITRLRNDFFPEYRDDQIELAGCLLVGAEIIIDTSSRKNGQE